MSTKKTNLYVVNHPDGWAVRLEGQKDVLSTHKTQADAIDRARSVGVASGNASVRIQKAGNGRFREERTYGPDPRETKG